MNINDFEMVSNPRSLGETLNPPRLFDLALGEEANDYGQLQRYVTGKYNNGKKSEFELLVGEFYSDQYEAVSIVPLVYSTKEETLGVIHSLIKEYPINAHIDLNEERSRLATIIKRGIDKLERNRLLTVEV